jgi:tetratricopeptide (TPR) repeat protein
MLDQPKASKFAKEAFDQWQAGFLEQSKLLYEAAISLADPQHWALSAYHGEFSCVLNALGLHEEASSELEKSLAVELAQGNLEGSLPVTIARYFLANQLLQRGFPERALTTLAPSTQHAPNDWLTLLGEAHILFALKRPGEAKVVASRAISNAPTPEKAESLKLNLEHILGAPNA